MKQLSPYQRSLLRDIREGHLTIWHNQGEDLPDRQILGGKKTWEPLAEQGYIELKPHANRWTITPKGIG